MKLKYPFWDPLDNKWHNGIMIDLCTSLTGIRSAHIAGKALFLDVSVMVFQEELVFESVDLVKVVTLINWGRHH